MREHTLEKCTWLEGLDKACLEKCGDPLATSDLEESIPPVPQVRKRHTHAQPANGVAGGDFPRTNWFSARSYLQYRQEEKAVLYSGSRGEVPAKDVQGISKGRVC